MSRVRLLDLLVTAALVLLTAGAAFGQIAGSPIAPARVPGGSAATPNPVWASAGVEGGIPYRTNHCGATINAYSGTATAINNALSSCSSGGGGVVVLGAGTFSLSTSVLMKANVTLRGQGMTTILSFTGMSSGFFYGGGATGVLFSGAFDASGYGQNPAQGGAPAANKRTWTATGGVSGSYPQGGTVLTLSSAPNSALSIGSMLTLWQLNDDDAAVPKPGYLVSSKTGAGSSAISWQGSGESRTSAMQQRVRVTDISGSTVTVTPGVFLPAGTWRSNRTPSAAWQGNDLRMAGIEDILIRSTAGPSNQWSVVQFWQAQNCWIARTAIQPLYSSFHAGGAAQNVIQIFESRNITVRDNWMDYAIGGGQGSTTTYGVSANQASNALVENNIFNRVESPLMFNSGATGNVYAYNFEINGTQQEGGIQAHEVGVSMNLVEGNVAVKIMADVFHGNSNFMTIFRNYFYSTTSANVDLWSYHRFWNVVGNVLSASSYYKSTVTDPTKRSRYEGVGIRLGYPSQDASAGPVTGIAADAAAASTALLWGNYSAADAQAHFSSSEVPAADAYYPNPVPADTTLPPSLFRSTRPAYFTVSGAGTVVWPPHGPDVAGGVAQNGRSHKLPAQLVYEAAGGSIAAFNPALYGSEPPSDNLAPASPRLLRTQ